MSQLQIYKLQKEFGSREVLKEVSFEVEYGERIGLVGDNGSGKSTLFSILAGELPASSGTLLFAEGQKIGYLKQDPLLDSTPSADAYPEFIRRLGEMGAGKEKLALNRQTLSGGERMKLALAQILASDPDLLLLDEPTNNLDYEGISALLEALYDYTGTILAISHDRYFLDRLVTRILELENGKMQEYTGNYTDYREEKARLFSERMHRYESDRQQQEEVEQAIRQLRDFSQKQHRLSTRKDSSGLRMGTKEFKRKQAKQMDKRVKSQMKRLERMRREMEPRPQEEARVRFALNAGAQRGKRLLEASSLSGGYDGRILFENTDFVLMRGEHAALFGPNGCGKTTLIRMIQRQLEPLGGSLWISPSAQPYVLSQSILDLPREQSAFSYFCSLWGTLTGEQRTQLACMGLRSDLLHQKMGALSLGEQMKVKLAELIFSHCDFILLDEPTNYLDLHARETLEDALSSFEGTLLVVSHDIYFLEQIGEITLAFENGVIRRYEQPFSDYLSSRFSF